MNRDINQNYYSRINKNISKQVYQERAKQVSYLFDKIKDFVDLKKSKWLDVGCGAGILGSELIRNFNTESYGIDLNKTSINQAKKFGVQSKVVDIEKRWPYSNNFFNNISIIQVMEHMNNTDNLILESKRVLKKGGLLIISTPNLGCWYNRLLLLLGYQPFFTEVSLRDKTLGIKFTRHLTAERDPAGHLRVFTMEGLKDLVEFYDLEIVKTLGGTVSYFPWYVSIIDKFISNIPTLASDLIVIAKKK